METVILNGARSADTKVDQVSEAMFSVLTGLGQVSMFKLREIAIADCVGCFGCWIKTPGECIINDAAKDIAKRMAAADLKVFVTPIVFGGYSYELKKMLDRQICLILPFFTKINGEVHHAPRYEHNGKLVSIGVLPEPDEESEGIFRTLFNRNAINMHTPTHGSIVSYYTDDQDTVTQKIKSVLNEVQIQ